MSKKAVFLDRDGVLNETVFRMGKPRAPYSLEELRLCEGVTEAIKMLRASGHLLIVVTNQPDVSRGWVAREIVDQINSKIMQDLQLDDLQACFHTEKDQCGCRKPRPGMLLQAAEKWNIDLEKSFMVGDRLSDIAAGLHAGCRTILVGEGDSPEITPVPHHHCHSLLEGARWITQTV